MVLIEREEWPVIERQRVDHGDRQPRAMQRDGEGKPCHPATGDHDIA